MYQGGEVSQREGGEKEDDRGGGREGEETRQDKGLGNYVAGTPQGEPEEQAATRPRPGEVGRQDDSTSHVKGQNSALKFLLFSCTVMFHES